VSKSQAKLLGLAEEHLGLPLGTQLEPNYRNPLDPISTITYQLAQAGQVVLSIWNLAGQLVRKLVAARQDACRYLVTWDGMDEAGGVVANGVYLYETRAGEFRSARRMVLTKWGTPAAHDEEIRCLAR